MKNNKTIIDVNAEKEFAHYWFYLGSANGILHSVSGTKPDFEAQWAIFHDGMLMKAIIIAKKAHKGQKDKAGEPYINHVMRVMAAGATMEERIVGTLHDVLEDCSAWNLAKLEQEGFSLAIIHAVHALTKDIDGPETYDEYIERVGKNPISTRVKLNDLTDNMNSDRLKVVTDRDRERTAKYMKAFKYLRNVDLQRI